MPKKRRSETLDISRLGARAVRNGKLVWTPPPPGEIDPALRKIIEDSVRALNRRVAKGELRLIGKRR